MVTTTEFARLAARPVDRVHIAASTVPTREALLAIEGFAVSPGDAALVVAFLDRDQMTLQELRLPLRYAPEDRIRARLKEAATKGAITFDDDVIAYTPNGALAGAAALDARATALERMWSNSPGAVDDAVALLAPVAAAAAEADRPSSQLTSRTLVARNPTLGSELWRRLAAVRRFRADCHAQAWAEAGHTVESIVALTHDAPARQPIENRTDELNAEIWTHLAEHDQLRLMAALASLDGSGTPT